TQTETANILGISQVKVSRIETKSKQKIKEYIAA
ncbi:MAG: sigma factor-like helix-turn-helix DNA-binding protein, partial [Bacilli bacterium]|nr:sigma factor-like helix-turn-helix DNA-binding protein [Bacilli bacterium]